MGKTSSKVLSPGISGKAIIYAWKEKFGELPLIGIYSRQLWSNKPKNSDANRTDAETMPGSLCNQLGPVPLFSMK